MNSDWFDTFAPPTFVLLISYPIISCIYFKVSLFVLLIFSLKNLLIILLCIITVNSLEHPADTSPPCVVFINASVLDWRTALNNTFGAVNRQNRDTLGGMSRPEKYFLI